MSMGMGGGGNYQSPAHGLISNQMMMMMMPY